MGGPGQGSSQVESGAWEQTPGPLFTESTPASFQQLVHAQPPRGATSERVDLEQWGAPGSYGPRPENVGDFLATVLNQSSDPQLGRPGGGLDAVAFKFGGSDYLDLSPRATELIVADSREEMKEGERSGSSREPSIASPKSRTVRQPLRAFSKHIPVNEERIEEKPSGLTQRRSEFSSSMENQADDLTGHLLISSQDNETRREDTSLLFRRPTGGAAIQNLAESFQSGGIPQPLRDIQTAATAVVSPTTGAGMPRRAPIKTKVIPGLTGVLAGETARKGLEDIDSFLNSQEHQRTLPKIKQRSTSIPPKTAAAPNPAEAAPFSPRPFGGRRPTNQPISPPSAIRVEGRQAQAQPIHKTSNKRFKVKLPDASSPVRPASIDRHQRSATALLDRPGEAASPGLRPQEQSVGAGSGQQRGV